MRIQVAGRQMDVGEALRSRIEADLETGVSKYFNRATDAVVTVGKNGGAGVAVGKAGDLQPSDSCHQEDEQAGEGEDGSDANENAAIGDLGGLL